MFLCQTFVPFENELLLKYILLCTGRTGYLDWANSRGYLVHPFFINENCGKLNVNVEY